MARANTITLPLLMDEPIRWRIGKRGPNDTERFARNKARLSQQPRPLRRGQGAGRNRRSDPGSPQDFIRHPIANARKSILPENNSLDRRPGVTIEEYIYKRSIEFVGRNLRSSRSPPFRFSRAMMKTYSPKETRILENEGQPFLVQDEMVMFLRKKAGWLRSQFACHAEMDPNPISTGKFEKHSLASRGGADQAATGQALHDLPRIAAAKNSFSRMKLHSDDFLAEAAIPLLAKKFHLGQFGHWAN